MSANRTIVENHVGTSFELHEHECPICERDDGRYVGTRGGSHHRYGYGFETRIFRCRGCGLLYPNPLPLPIDINALYADSAKYFSNHSEQAKLTNAADFVSEAVSRVPGAQRLLDVGSGRGEVLHAAQEAGLEAIGLEVSESFASESTDRFGADVRLETLESFRASNDEDFDIIVMNAVLEHVPNPNAFMAAGSELLSRRGVMRIDVPREPNLMSMGADLSSRLRGKRVSHCLSPSWEPYHLHGFSPRPMRVLLAKFGLAMQDLQVRASTRVPTDGTVADRLRGLGASVMLRIGNATRLSSNMDLWAIRAGEGRSAPGQDRLDRR